MQARIWHCGTHGDFHAKLYLWRLRNGAGVAWIGSANLTDGGLVNRGELVLELRGAWASPQLRKLRKAYEQEWRTGKALTSEFVHRYRESERPAPDGRPAKRAGHSRARPPGTNERYFTTNATQNFPEGSPVVERVRQRLNRSADTWLMHYAKSLRNVKVGDRCLFVDQADKRVALVEVTDTTKYGKAYVFAYEPLRARAAWLSWTKARRAKLAATVGGRGGALGSKWLDHSRWLDAARILYGHRQRVA